MSSPKIKLTTEIDVDSLGDVNLFSRCALANSHCVVTADSPLNRWSVIGKLVSAHDPGKAMVVASEEELSKCWFAASDASYFDRVIDMGEVSFNPFVLTNPDIDVSSLDHREYDQIARRVYRAKMTFLTSLFNAMRIDYENASGDKVEYAPFARMLQILIARLYQSKGIGITAGNWNFEQWAPEASPTLADFAFLLRTYRDIVANYDTREKVMGWGKVHLTPQGALMNKTSKQDRCFFGYYRYIDQGNALWGADELSAIKDILNVVECYIGDDDEFVVVRGQRPSVFEGKVDVTELDFGGKRVLVKVPGEGTTSNILGITAVGCALAVIVRYAGLNPGEHVVFAADDMCARLDDPVDRNALYEFMAGVPRSCSVIIGMSEQDAAGKSAVVCEKAATMLSM